MTEEVKLEKCSFTFSQEGNGNGTTEDVEELTIDCESPLGIDRDGGCFFVLRTNTGWSIDSIDDLKELFNRMNKAIQGGEQ
jgi:hypothetical protein